MFVDVPVLPATATCDEKVHKDIFTSLGLDDETLTMAVVLDRSVTSTATLYNMLRTVHFYRRNLFGSLTCFITTLMRRAVKEYYSLLKTMTVNLNACFHDRLWVGAQIPNV